MRKSAVAGFFYPDSPSQLAQKVESFHQNVELPEIPGRVRGIISPHAGYDYSGQVAAYGFESIKAFSQDTIILLGPSHYVPFKGASVYKGKGYETPLGAVVVDQEKAQKIRDHHELIDFESSAHVKEHSLEVQLPFLQKLWGTEFKIIPILFGSHGLDECIAVGDAILKVFDNDPPLILASSDFSHFYTYDIAKEMDHKAIRMIEAWQIKALIEGVRKREVEMCGYSAILTLSYVMRKLGVPFVKPLRYANSGDVTGDRNRVVGYSSIIYHDDKGT